MQHPGRVAGSEGWEEEEEEEEGVGIGMNERCCFFACCALVDKHEWRVAEAAALS